jgi:ATP-dependent RNA helicase DeaD
VPFPSTHAAFERALQARAYIEPTPVQAAVLGADAHGRDLLVSAQTGSGKTVAFGLAIGPTLLGGTAVFEAANEPLALVIAPTRELALQVQRELAWLYEHTGARIVSCVGGMDPQQERRQLNRGSHIVVGTPGRLRDHLERGTLRMASTRAVVLDEADEMLDLGFREDLEFILQAMPADRRTLLFSATLPKSITTLARQFQSDALRIAASGGARGHTDIEYRAVRIAANDTEHAVVNLLRYYDSPSALVFCNTRDAVRHLHATLLERNFAVVSLSGEFSQKERNFALQALRDGKARVCVATDVAARGIDLPGLGLVIHADLPNDIEALQHRSGRTGRAGRKGISVLIVPASRHRRAERLLATANIRASWGTAPSAQQIRKLDGERLLQTMLAADTGDAQDAALAKILLAQRSPEDIAAALVRMHRAQLPAPEDIGELDQAPEAKAGKWTPREKTAGSTMTWFSMNVGRARKADPKWLLPEICRQGGVTKRDVGAIRIFDQETKFEIDERVAASFAERIAQVSKGDVFIRAAEAPAESETAHRSSPHAKPHKPRFKEHYKPREKSGHDGWHAKSEHKAHKKPHAKGAKQAGKPFHKGPKPKHKH